MDKSCGNSEFMARIDKEQELIKSGFTGSFSCAKTDFLVIISNKFT